MIFQGRSHCRSWLWAVHWEVPGYRSPQVIPVISWVKTHDQGSGSRIRIKFLVITVLKYFQWSLWSRFMAKDQDQGLGIGSSSWLLLSSSTSGDILGQDSWPRVRNKDQGKGLSLVVLKYFQWSSGSRTSTNDQGLKFRIKFVVLKYFQWSPKSFEHGKISQQIHKILT